MQMTRSRQTNRDSMNGSESSEDDSDDRSPPRGRTGKTSKDEVEPDKVEEAVEAQINAMMDEDSKKSGM